MYASNRTLDERERLAFINGDRAALDMLGAAEEEIRNGEAVSTASVHTQEARGCYPSEDFLAKPLESLRTLSKRLRGDNRGTVAEIIEALETIQTETHQAAEYGRDELDKAQTALDGL